jgi:hypothetical protein
VISVWVLNRLIQWPFDSAGGQLALPPYTDQLAATYLQVLFEGFLFAVAVPAAIYNLIDSDIRHLAQTRARARRYLLGTALLYVAVLALVWLIPTEPAPQPGAGPPELSSRIKSLVVIVTVIVLPFGVLVMGLWLNRQFERERVIRRLANKLADGLLERLEGHGGLDADAFKDLSYLGEHSKAGDEKQFVLDAIGRLAGIVQEKVKRRGLRYNGYELQSLILLVPAMLENAVQPQGDQNYRRAVEVLTNLWRWLGKGRVTDDAISTSAALGYLALRAVERPNEDTALTYLDAVAECDSRMVFEMGLAALVARKYRVASGALTKLETIAYEVNQRAGDPYQRRMSRANLLGMVAHFAADGEAGFRRAETSLSMNPELFTPTLRAALADAFDYHYQDGGFETADKTVALVAEAGRMRGVNLYRDVPEAPQAEGGDSGDGSGGAAPAAPRGDDGKPPPSPPAPEAAAAPVETARPSDGRPPNGLKLGIQASASKILALFRLRRP